MELSVAQKYVVCKTGFALAFPVAAFCLYRMIQAYTPHEIKRWFTLMMLDCIAGVICGLGFYWYRARLMEPDAGQVEITTLAQVSIHPARLPDSPAAPQAISSKDPASVDDDQS